MEMPNSSVKEPNQQLPRKSYVGRFVKLPMDSHGSMKACLVKILFLARKRECDEKSRYPHHDDELAKIGNQRIDEGIGQPRTADAERKDQHLAQRFVFAGHDADQAEHDGQFQKSDGFQPRRVEEYPASVATQKMTNIWDM